MFGKGSTSGEVFVLYRESYCLNCGKELVGNLIDLCADYDLQNTMGVFVGSLLDKGFSVANCLLLNTQRFAMRRRVFACSKVSLRGYFFVCVSGPILGEYCVRLTKYL